MTTTPAETHASPPRRAGRLAAHDRPTPLAAVLAFVFFNSLSSGVGTTAFAFVAESAFGFGPTENYALGLVQGVTYIVGALAVGPVLRRLLARLAWLTGRGVLAGLLVALGAGCAMPLTVRGLTGGEGGAWTIWVLIGLYSLLTGVLWPLCESFLSGGRSGRRLVSAVGLFNIAWSSALVVTFWIIGPLVSRYPLEVVAGSGVIHVLSGALLPLFNRDPGHHGAHVHTPHPPVYRDLLRLMRIELPASYLVYSALGPYLPAALEGMGVAESWRTPIVATWLATRVITFAVLERWHGWHGTWSSPIVGGVLLLAGFALTLLSPALLAPGAALPAFVVGLGVFGVGMGTIYSAAIYYAMEVGAAEVEAGGTHEALIGLGYGGGPICGLFAAGLVRAGVIEARLLPVTVVIAVAVVTTPVIGYAIVRAHARRRKGVERH